MKLVTTEKKYLEDTIFEIAYETIEKFSGLNACAKIENLDLDLSDLKQDGNAFVYVTKLDINGNVNIEDLKDIKEYYLLQWVKNIKIYLKRFLMVNMMNL